MDFLNENITWAFFVYFGQLLSGLSLTVSFFKNFGIVIVFSYFLVVFFNSQRWTKLATLQYFCWLRWPAVERQSFFWFILLNTEDKRRNGGSQDIIFVLQGGLILKTCLCCHLCPKIGLNYPSRWFISLKSEDTKILGLKLNLGMDKLDNGVAVGTSIQKWA